MLSQYLLPTLLHCRHSESVTAQLQRRVATLQGKLGRNIKASKTMSSRSKAQPDGGVAQQWRANVGDLEELLQDL